MLKKVETILCFLQVKIFKTKFLRIFYMYNILLFVSAFSYFSLGFVDLVSLMPCILDVVLPLNNTRTRKFSYQAEFFLDIEKYFYPILFHTWITMFFGVTILITTESIFLMFAQHCCSMFKILWYVKLSILYTFCFSFS